MNQLLNKILFATDFSEGAARAQATAFFLATACRARLEFLHVFEYQPDAFPDNLINDQVIDEIRAGIGRQLDELVSRDGTRAERERPTMYGHHQRADHRSGNATGSGSNHRGHSRTHRSGAHLARKHGRASREGRALSGPDRTRRPIHGGR